MASLPPQVHTVLSVLWNHPILSCSVLLLFSPPFYNILMFFSPLLISTALFVVALVSMGPHFEETKDCSAKEVDDNVKDLSSKKNSSWMDWAKEIQDKGMSWLENKFNGGHKSDMDEKRSAFIISEETFMVPASEYTPASDDKAPEVENEQAVVAKEDKVSEEKIDEKNLLKEIPNEVIPEIEAVEVYSNGVSEIHPTISEISESEKIDNKNSGSDSVDKQEQQVEKGAEAEAEISSSDKKQYTWARRSSVPIQSAGLSEIEEEEDAASQTSSITKEIGSTDPSSI